MNYYIKGDAANADKIKAAFESKGYDTTGWKFNVEGGFYYTAERKRIDLACGNFLINLIKTHPDYEELKLPVEPLFKIGDWLYHNTLGVHPILVKDYSKRQGYKVEGLGLTYCLQKGVVENEYHLWSIEDAKDGDVLALNGKPFIYSHNYGKNYCYIDACGQFRANFNLVFEGNCVCPATKEQRILLFKKMQKAGYQWYADKKELRKIKPRYDIANFHAGMPVLVRDCDEHKWLYTLFGIYNKDNSLYPFVVVNMRGYAQCIPFNDDTKHLLGTTDMCPEEYINW